MGKSKRRQKQLPPTAESASNSAIDGSPPHLPPPQTLPLSKKSIFEDMERNGKLFEAMSPQNQKGPISTGELNERICELRKAYNVDPKPISDKREGLRRIGSGEFQDLIDANLALVDWENSSPRHQAFDPLSSNSFEINPAMDDDSRGKTPLLDIDNNHLPSLGLRNAIYTLTGSIVGAGAISCPFAFQFMGFFGGFFMLSSLGFLSGYCGYLLGIAARKTGLHSYEGIAIHVFGKRTGKFIGVGSVVGVTFLATIAYMNLWADLGLPLLQVLFSKVFALDISDSKINLGRDTPEIFCLRTLLILACGLMIFPLCAKREIAGVAFASLLSIVAMGVLTVVILFYFVSHSMQTSAEWAAEENKFDWLGWGRLTRLTTTATEEDSKNSNNGFKKPSFFFVHEKGGNRFTDHRNHPCFGVFSEEPSRLGEARTWFDLPGLLMGIPYFCSAFLCHFNVFSVFSELRNPTQRRLKKVMRRTIYTSGALYATIAVCGFFTALNYESYEVSLKSEAKDASKNKFLNPKGNLVSNEESYPEDRATCLRGVQGNILMNFPADSLLPNLGRGSLFFALFCTLPLLIHPCRASLHRCFFGDAHRSSNIQLFMETFLILSFASFFAVLIPQVQVILGYAGSTFGVLLAFVFPSIFVIRLSTRSVKEDLWGKGVSYLILILGLFLCVATTWVQARHSREMANGRNIRLSSSNIPEMSPTAETVTWWRWYRAMKPDGGGPWKREKGEECRFLELESLGNEMEKVRRYAEIEALYKKSGEGEKIEDRIRDAEWARKEACE